MQYEGTFFAPFNISTNDQFLAFLQQNTNPLANDVLNSTLPTILSLYPDNPDVYSPHLPNDTFPYGVQFKRMATVVSDVAVLQPRREFSVAAAASGVPVLAYLFSAPEAISDKNLGGAYSLFLNLVLDSSSLVSHNAELPFLFSNLPLPSTRSDTKRLQDKIMDLWIEFGYFAGAGGKQRYFPWPPYKSGGQVLEFVGGRRVVIEAKDTFHLSQTTSVLDLAPE